MNQPHSCVTIVPLFGGLTADEQRDVELCARPIRRSRGETIYAPGDDVSQLMVVHQGRVKIYHLSASGAEQLLRVLEPGDVIGEGAFITGSRPDHYAVALADTQLCTFNHADLKPLIAQYPDIAMRMLRTVATQLESTERMLAAVTTEDVSIRLARYLLDLPARFVDGHVSVELALPKKEIASYLGTTPETLSRRLAAFMSEGVIDVRGSVVTILDVDALEDHASGER